jgi:3-oxoacyl-[acyl-carrier protein] reductase
VTPRSVIVTGGSRGLGVGLVQAFIDAGDIVATCSRSRTPAIDAWESDPALAERFHYQELDLSDRAACDEFVGAVAARFGSLDVLVNNAGVAREGVLGLMQDEDVATVLDLNVKGTIQITRAAVRRMLPQGSGSVINISSVVGISGYRGLAVYGASKAALDGFTRAMARELGTRQITVNSVAPGYLRTEMSLGLDETQLNQISRRTPLGRLGEAEDVAGAVLFLASEQARFITGQVIVVDGGLTA